MIKYIIPGVIGIVGGLFVGFGVLFIGSSVDPGPARIAAVIEIPVGLLTRLVCGPPPQDGSPDLDSFKWWFIFHFIYWALLGSLFCIGFQYLRQKVMGYD